MSGFMSKGGGSAALDFQDLGSVSGNLDIKAAKGKAIKIKPSGSLAIMLSSSAGACEGEYIILHIKNGGAATVNWAENILWDGGAAPVLQSVGEDIIVAYTTDSGRNWFAWRDMTLNEYKVNIWDGTIGTVPTPVNSFYTVNTCAELAAIAAAVNAGTLATAGNTFRLTCNLDLNNKEWTACAMDGTFDGSGYEILNFTQTSANSNATHGFFTTIGSSGVIKNVTLTGAITSAADGENHSAGTIAITNNGTIKNCVINVSYTITTSFNFGQSFSGIVNKNVGTIENVLRTGKMSGGSLSTMIGVCYSNYGTIHNVVSIGDITAGNKAFGLTNLSNQNNSVFSNCVVVGNIGNYGLGNQFNVIRNCVFVGTSGESGYNISSWGTEENVFATSGQSYGCTIVATADAPAAAILLDKYEHSVGNIPVTATAYPTISTQAGTVEVTAGSGMTVSPTEISSGTEMEIAVTGTGDLTFAVPAAVLAAATNKCSPTVALAVA